MSERGLMKLMPGPGHLIEIFLHFPMPNHSNATLLVNGYVLKLLIWRN